MLKLLCCYKYLLQCLKPCDFVTHRSSPLHMCLFDLDTGNPTVSSPALPPSPLPYLSARVGSLELANALAACVLSARLTSKHRQWAAEQLVQALAATGRDSPNRPQTYSDLAGDLRKCPLKRLEGHYNKVRARNIIYSGFLLRFEVFPLFSQQIEMFSGLFFSEWSAQKFLKGRAIRYRRKTMRVFVSTLKQQSVYKHCNTSREIKTQFL